MATRAKFTWPPKPVAAPASPASDPACAGSVDVAPPPSRSVIAEIETVWLGRTRAPLAERLSEAGWARDSREGYCPRCASSAGPFAPDDTGCGWCRGTSPPWERAVRLGDYSGLLRDLVLEVKFTRWRRLGDQLGRMLGKSLAAELELAGVDRGRAFLVPVPMSFRRWLLTGIDHSLVVCRGVAAATGIPMVRALTRRHRPSQREVAPSKRAANVAAAFRPRPGVRLPASSAPGGRVAVLVDDVRTTGATLTAACRTLRKADPGLRLWTAVLGVTPGQAGRPGAPRAARGGVRFDESLRP